MPIIDLSSVCIVYTDQQIGARFPSGKEPPQPIAKAHSCVVAVCCCAFDGLAMELPFKVDPLPEMV